MATTNLIVALVFAGIFGTALVYLGLWYVHCYIHQRCYELEHWFHFLFPSRTRPPPVIYVEKVEQRESERYREPSKHRSRSAKRERGRSERSQTRKYYEGRDVESQRVGYGNGNGNGNWAGHRDGERARPVMQIGGPQQQQPYGQSYYPPGDWQEECPGVNFVCHHPGITQRMPVSWQSQVAAQMPPFSMPTSAPQQPFQQMAATMPEPIQYPPQYQPRDRHQHRQPYAETMSTDVPKTNHHRTPPVKPKSPAKRARRHEKVDFIDICDEYPPIVLEGLKKEALKKAAPPSSSSSSSSCSSDPSGATQEVPRESIPRATPGFADTLPFEYPPHPYSATRAWNTPRSYPRQWMRDTTGADGLDNQARYAPFTPMSGYRARPWGLHTNRTRPAPSNATLIPLLVCRLKSSLFHGVYADNYCNRL